MADHWKVDRRLLKHICEVSRLKLSEEEVEMFTGQLQVILEAFKELDEFDTDGVEPSFHPSELKNVLREDEASLWSWGPMDNTQHKEGKYFKGPRIT